MWHRYAAVFAAFFLVLMGAPVAAQQVTLRATEGTLVLSGTLLGFDGTFYRLETRFGEITVDGDRVTCEGECPDRDTYIAELSVSGSATIGTVLMPALLESFARRNGWATKRIPVDETHFTYELRHRDQNRIMARFRFRVTNTDEGFADLLADEADIVMALREISPGEIDRARDIGLGNMSDALRSRVLALDALVPVVAARNPVKELSLEELTGLVAGDITQWSFVGGSDAPVSVHLRDTNSGLAQHLDALLLSGNDLALREDATRHETNSALDQAVAGDDTAFGVSTFSQMTQARPVPLTGPCGFTLHAERQAIKSGDYPLVAPMYLYVPARRLPTIGREFLSFTRSASAQIVIRRAGFIDQLPEEVGLDTQGTRLANAITVADGNRGLDGLQRIVTTLGPMKRLTTAFRFTSNSDEMSSQSRSNIWQLARALANGRYAGRRLVFVGFGDGLGTAAQTQIVALRRADTVREAVRAAIGENGTGLPEMEVDAFGPAMPLACDDTAAGRQVNRRVEVWVN